MKKFQLICVLSLTSFASCGVWTKVQKTATMVSISSPLIFSLENLKGFCLRRQDFGGQMLYDSCLLRHCPIAETTFGLYGTILNINFSWKMIRCQDYGNVTGCIGMYKTKWTICAQPSTKYAKVLCKGNIVLAGSVIIITWPECQYQNRT